MGEEKINETPEEEASKEQESQPLPKDPQESAWTQPGHIPEPKEKSWDQEPANPFDGVDRSNPFEGRPKTDVPQPEQPHFEGSDPGPGQPLPPPGQPLPRKDTGSGSDN